MWTLIMKLPHTEVKFYPEVKSQTDLSSLRVSCIKICQVLIINLQEKVCAEIIVYDKTLKN